MKIPKEDHFMKKETFNFSLSSVKTATSQRSVSQLRNVKIGPIFKGDAKY